MGCRQSTPNVIASNQRVNQDSSTEVKPELPSVLTTVTSGQPKNAPYKVEFIAASGTKKNQNLDTRAKDDWNGEGNGWEASNGGRRDRISRGRGRGGGRGRGRGRKRWIDGYYTGRMYGRFQCAECNKRWESSNVYMIEGQEGVFYEQQCKACYTSMQPYQAEPITCRYCGKENCICEDFEERHVDVNKPHLSHLCGRCKSGRPCRQGQTYTDSYDYDYD